MMSSARLVVAVLVAALVVAGCGLTRVGGPAPVSGRTCQGVPAPVCARMFADAQRNATPGSGPLVGMRIVCRTTCTEAAGDASVTITYANGETTEGAQGWSSPQGTAPGEPGGTSPIALPTLPIAPVCIGLPSGPCAEQAQSAMASLNGADPASVVLILITCRTTCTAATGDGGTVVTFGDGTRLESGWSYRPPG
jgi:hypothetical protein